MYEPGPKSLQILAIDDDLDLLTTIEMQLRLRGYRVLTAVNGEEGMQIAQKAEPDVVLLDIGLTERDGIEIAREMRTNFRTLAVGIIMLTARSEQTAMRGAVAAGADDYVLKPYDLDELCSRIEMVHERTLRNLERNPLTGLPGNTVIRAELQRRIDRCSPFALGYVDLDHFKSLNDKYGPERGDKAIHSLSQVMIEVMDFEGPQNDFVGHIGGDDFVFITTPDKVRTICLRLFRRYDEVVSDIYDPADLARGGIEVKGRDGKLRVFPKITLSIGVAVSSLTQIEKVQRAFELATEAKRRAKQRLGNYFNIWGETCSLTPKAESPRLLIVEDDADIAYILACRLEREGYKCHTVDNVSSAQKALSSLSPDLMLVDISLPGEKDGRDLVLELRRNEKMCNIPIIIMSAMDSDFDRLISAEVGANMFISKPFELDDVVASVDGFLRRAEQPDADIVTQ